MKLKMKTKRKAEMPPLFMLNNSKKGVKMSDNLTTGMV